MDLLRISLFLLATALTLAACQLPTSNPGVTTKVENTPPAWHTVGVAGFSGGTEVQDLALDSSGKPYVAYVVSSVGGPVGVMKFNGTAWASVGSPDFENYYGTPSLALDAGDTPYVAYADTAHGNKVSVMKFSGGSWVQVGTAGFSPGAAYETSLAIDATGVPYVAYRDAGSGYKASVMKFEDGAWVQVGAAGFSEFVDNAYVTLALDASGTPYVAYQNTDNALSVMKFNGTLWAQVGNAGFAATGYQAAALAFDSSDMPYVSYVDSANSFKASVMKFDDGAWVRVGTADLSAVGSTNATTALAFDASDTLYLNSSYWITSGFIDVMKFDGSAWVMVGTAPSLGTDGDGASLALDASGTPYVAYSTYDVEENSIGVTVKKFK